MLEIFKPGRLKRRSYLAACYVIAAGMPIYYFAMFDQLSFESAFLTSTAVLATLSFYLFSGFATLSLLKAIHPKAAVLAALFAFIIITTPSFFAIVFAVLQSTYLCISGYEAPGDEIYFSYTTLTALGYGGLKPPGICRVASSTEAVFGYLLLGTLVATVFHFLSARLVESDPNP